MLGASSAPSYCSSKNAARSGRGSWRHCTTDADTCLSTSPGESQVDRKSVSKGSGWAVKSALRTGRSCSDVTNVSTYCGAQADKDATKNAATGRMRALNLVMLQDHHIFRSAAKRFSFRAQDLWISSANASTKRRKPHDIKRNLEYMMGTVLGAHALHYRNESYGTATPENRLFGQGKSCQKRFKIALTQTCHIRHLVWAGFDATTFSDQH
mmetsp:Transcript_22711/g.37498  ORF Transcript_22711/g.37498 Transcript_22711/m.37498 type:complete len:211 (-) Transcript_22711:4239-4871(-)